LDTEREVSGLSVLEECKATFTVAPARFRDRAGRGFTKLSKIGMKNASPPEYHE